MRGVFILPDESRQMKPIFLKIDSSNTYNIREQVQPYVQGKYYYHPQVELVWFHKGDGMCIVGDKVQFVKQGDLFMLGSNLPHLFRNDERHLDPRLKVHLIVLHFMPSFWGEAFLDMPDMRPIRTLIKKAERGLLIQGSTSQKVGELMKQMLHETGPGRIIKLLKALSLVASSRDRKYLLPTGFQPIIDDQNEDRVNDVYSYTMENFQRKITTREIAAVAHLSEHSFCRYFKTKTGKTYTAFLHEIRIRHACKLLSESSLSISQVIGASGFVNYTNFFRYFKQLTGKTPAEYQKLSNESLVTER